MKVPTPLPLYPIEKAFSFTSEETRFTQEEPVTKKNWLLNVNHLRILKEARRG
ncbi:hypothetical protein JCM19232_4968 [Vibrio ishigakensis]|uniref:Uncharacterized protein n=1 Tax=Vibrio ishigakensis TaxID=1481914 RepID=A0A0B8PQR3_9VIBR|nr:hypothetical protein JCM19232_4968 [Vibrio ishigakensis]